MNKEELIVRVLCNLNLHAPAEAERERQKIYKIYERLKREMDFMTSDLFAKVLWLTEFNNQYKEGQE